MTGNPFLDLVALPIGFGLFGFIEPCSIGSTLIFVKVMEGKSAAVKIAQASLIAGVRALFFGFQKAAWLFLGGLYVALGVAYLSGRIGWLMRRRGTLRAGAHGARLAGRPIAPAAALDRASPYRARRLVHLVRSLRQDRLKPA